MKNIYLAHPMENDDISIEGSGKRGQECRDKAPEFKWSLAEEWQDGLAFSKIVGADLAKLNQADIVVVDLYKVGMEGKKGTLHCIGTLMETGYAMAKDKYIVIITRNRKHIHPFYLAADFVCNSLDAAIKHLKRLK